MSEEKIMGGAPSPSGSVELAPCPFCGGEAMVFEDSDHGGWSAGCDDFQCQASVGRYPDQESAVFYWNRRTPLPAPPEPDHV